MGQKTHPTGFRIAITEPWRSRWYANKKDFSKFLVEDQMIRRFIRDNWAFAAIPRVEIERAGEVITVFLHTARPGILIGKKGAKVDKFREDLEKLTGKAVRMKIMEIHRPELESALVAESLAEMLSKRMNYRRALKKAAETSMAAGALGIKIMVAGRLQGAEMARVGEVRRGRIPCTTLRAKLDYGTCVSKTGYGTIGVKVWIFKGEYGPGETTQGLLPVRTRAERQAERL
ncbi:MAG: 30S ribosomal protein S3 [Planctomycetota bacterium]|jgi:small subunit ribosomal protein S3|nr:30S ribosomal protein S3 [Planctomycetota bacterium]